MIETCGKCGFVQYRADKGYAMITTLALSPAVDKVFFIDGFRPGALFRVKEVVRSAGGKGVNAARVASILGHRVSCMGFKAGMTGEWLERELKSLGVKTAFVEVKGESRTNNNIIDRLNGTETEILEAGPFIETCDESAFINRFDNILSDTVVLVCSGGLPGGIPDSYYKQLINKAHSKGIKTILDTSGNVLVESIKAKPYMIKPNIRELVQYAGRQLNTLDDLVGVCRQVICKGVGIVVVSLGEEGSILVSESVTLIAKVPRVNAVNTIGSGDSMVAGLASGLCRGYSANDMLRLASACSVANTQFAEIGFVTPETVDRYLKVIEITEYDNDLDIKK